MCRAFVQLAFNLPKVRKFEDGTPAEFSKLQRIFPETTAVLERTVVHASGVHQRIAASCSVTNINIVDPFYFLMRACPVGMHSPFERAQLLESSFSLNKPEIKHVARAGASADSLHSGVCSIFLVCMWFERPRQQHQSSIYIAKRRKTLPLM